MKFFGWNCRGQNGHSNEQNMFTIIPVAYEATTTFLKGTGKGPESVLLASRQLEPYDFELDVHVCDYGVETLSIIREANYSEMSKKVSDSVSSALKTNSVPVAIGGEHTITLPIVSAVNKEYGNVSVLWIDAHADLVNEFENERYAHYTVGRRVYETVDGRMGFLGVRVMSEEEKVFVDDHRVPVIGPLFDKRELLNMLNELNGPLYISIDLDALDPGIMPSVGTPEPGGLSWYQLMDLLMTVAERNHIVGFDVVEYCPINGFVQPAYTVARLIQKFMNFIYFNKQK